MQPHAEVLRVEDGEPELVQAIKERRWRDLPQLSPRERALCTLAEKLSATPTGMARDGWRPLREPGSPTGRGLPRSCPRLLLDGAARGSALRSPAPVPDSKRSGSRR